jgi:hypothetical protein
MMLRGGLKRTPACGQSAHMGAEPAPCYNEHDAPWRSVPGQRVSRSLAQIARPDAGSNYLPCASKGAQRSPGGQNIKTLCDCPACCMRSSSGAPSPRPDQVARQPAQRGAVRARSALLTNHKMPAMGNLPVIIENCRVEHDQSNGPFGAKGVWRGRNVVRFASDCRCARRWRRHSADRSAVQSAYHAGCATAGYPPEEERT